MRKNDRSGFMISYTKDNGITQRGIIRHSEQDPEIIRARKVKIRLLDDEFKPLLDENKIEQIILKDKALVKIIGFVD